MPFTYTRYTFSHQRILLWIPLKDLRRIECISRAITSDVAELPATRRVTLLFFAFTHSLTHRYMPSLAKPASPSPSLSLSLHLSASESRGKVRSTALHWFFVWTRHTNASERETQRHSKLQQSSHEACWWLVRLTLSLFCFSLSLYLFLCLSLSLVSSALTGGAAAALKKEMFYFSCMYQ